jgi:hypothetical protein
VRDVEDVQIIQVHVPRLREQKGGIVDQVIEAAAGQLCSLCRSLLQGDTISNISFEDGHILNAIFGETRLSICFVTDQAYHNI